LKKVTPLTSCNQYFSELLGKIAPPSVTLRPIPNSDEAQQESLTSIPGFRDLFSGAGMKIICDETWEGNGD
jgi:hypothetical protein